MPTKPLIKEGMPREEIERLCDAHLLVFKKALQGEKRLSSASRAGSSANLFIYQ